MSTGGFESQTTSGVTDLAAIARGAGIEHVASTGHARSVRQGVHGGARTRRLSVIVAHVPPSARSNIRHGLAAAGERVSLQALDRTATENGRPRTEGRRARCCRDPIRPGYDIEAATADPVARVVHPDEQLLAGASDRRHARSRRALSRVVEPERDRFGRLDGGGGAGQGGVRKADRRCGGRHRGVQLGVGGHERGGQRAGIWRTAIEDEKMEGRRSS